MRARGEWRFRAGRHGTSVAASSAVRSRACLVATSLLGVIAPGLTRAQSAPDDVTDALREGIALRRDGRAEEALPLLARAVEVQRSGRALAELGYAEGALGRWLEAESHLTEALQLADDRWVRHHRRDLEGALDTVRASIGRVRVSSNVEGAVVRINGSVAGRTPLAEAVRVGVGRASVELRREGYRTAARDVMVNAEGDVEAYVALEREAPPPAEAPPPQCAPGLVLRGGLCFAPAPPPVTGVTPARVMLVGGGGLAVLSAAIAVGLWAGGDADAEAYLAACGGMRVPVDCAERHRSTQNDLDGRAAAINTLWVVAGLGLATGIAGALLEWRPWQRRSYSDGSRFVLAPNGLQVRW